MPVHSYLLNIPHPHSLLPICHTSPLAQAIICGDEQERLVMNPGSFPWAHWDCPTITPYAQQEDLNLNSTSHRPHGFLFHERRATSSHSAQAH